MTMCETPNSQSFAIRSPVLWGLIVLAALLTGLRGIEALRDLVRGDETLFLAYPLAVLTPALAFAFLATRRAIVSEEGVLMQLGAMIQLILILALPGFALYLALGFPVVFLVVELFETRCPANLRQPLKRMVVA